ncbi:MAG: aldose 1-epimerase [Planctomycetota bacterium]|nr:MAG: aldose 1-epimerase [Planctomycetota bacterium]
MKSFVRRMLTIGILLGGSQAFIGCEVREDKSIPTLGGASGPASIAERVSSKESTPSVTSELFGKNDKGDDVVRYNLQNSHGMKVSVLNLGAIITSVEVPDRDGKFANVTLNFPDVTSYLVNAPYFGGVCGRYANRIAKGKFTLDSMEYELEVNNGPNHLHGGKVGLMKRIWKSEGFQNDEAVGVNLWYISPDGEEGYPGKVRFGVAYSLNDQNELRIEYQAETDKPTVLNVTNHAYWNLAGVPDGSILDHELTLCCSKYLPVDETSIPTGELVDVAGTPMDFLKPEKIGARIDQTVNGGGGYDHCYVVDGQPGKLRPAAKIVEPQSGRVMEISTTEPGIQFYTGNFLDGTPATGNAAKHGAFCLETQHFPDSPNRPEFPTTRLNPGESYQQTTVHKFSVAK